jgi:hypothetical protein
LTKRKKIAAASWDTRPRKVVTAKGLNDINRTFWEKQALIERIKEATGLTEEQKAQMLEHGSRMIDARIKAERQAEDDRELGQKLREHAQRGQTTRSRAADSNAESFVKAVTVLRKANALLSQTGAVRQVAKRMKVSESTAWEYMKRARKG